MRSNIANTGIVEVRIGRYSNLEVTKLTTLINTLRRQISRMSLTPTATATDPPPANSPTMHSRMVHEDPQIYFFPLGDLRPFLSQNC